MGKMTEMEKLREKKQENQKISLGGMISKLE